MELRRWGYQFGAIADSHLLLGGELLGDPEGDRSGRRCHQDALHTDQDRRCTDSYTCPCAIADTDPHSCTHSHTDADPHTVADAHASTDAHANTDTCAGAHTGPCTHTDPCAHSKPWAHPDARAVARTCACTFSASGRHCIDPDQHRIRRLDRFHAAGHHVDCAWCQVDLRFQRFRGRWFCLGWRHHKAGRGRDEHSHFRHERAAGTTCAVGGAGGHPAGTPCTAPGATRYTVD
jgi:hypothetical protein